MRLTVGSAEREGVFRDIARIPEEHRVAPDGRPIKEGTVCSLTVGTELSYVLLRGLGTSKEAVICLDERKRNELGLALGATADFDLRPAGLVGQFLWAWHASGARIPGHGPARALVAGAGGDRVRARNHKSSPLRS
jgi:hypothetical protein